MTHHPHPTHTRTHRAETADEDDVHFDDHHVLVLSLEATSVEALASLEAAEVQVHFVCLFMCVCYVGFGALRCRRGCVMVFVWPAMPYQPQHAIPRP